MDLSDWIERNADFTPDATAILFEGQALTYGAMAERVARAAGALASGLGVKPGERIAFLGYNNPQMIVLLFACARIGAMLIPLNWRLAPPEHRRMIAESRPTAFFVEPDFMAHAAGMADANPGMRLIAMGKGGIGGKGGDGGEGTGDWLTYDALMAEADPLAAGCGGARLADPILLCYTSGATGAPKGAVLTQEALLFNAINSTHMCDMTRADRVLTTLPMVHVGGLNIHTLPAFHAGASVVLQAKFDPVATCQDLERERITLCLLVPAQIMAIIEMPQWPKLDLGHLRMLAAGSTLVPHSLIRAIHQRGIPVIQVYGSTETAPIATYGSILDARRKVGSAGKPALHCAVRIVGEDGADQAAGTSGEILVRGPNVMREYWQAPELTAQALRNGWFYTGDIGHFDEEGFLFVDDRKKEMIISGAENIYPAELENLLADCAELDEAAVVGRADEKWGEVPVAVVVRKPGADIDEDGVKKFFAGRIARFKHPHQVIFVAALPRNAMGKVIKDELRDLVAGAENN